jgi:short-chain fatty acids transporter
MKELTVKTSQTPSPSTPKSSRVGKVANLFVHIIGNILPDPYVIAVLLTLLTCLLSLAIAPHASISGIVSGWYDGVWKISSFAFLVALTFVTGHALSTSRPVFTLLQKIASIPDTPLGAMILIFFVSLVASLLNWAVGLVVSALFARELAKRVRVDFAWLLAAGYVAWSFFVCGISSSIALLSATPGSAVNVIERVFGRILPMNEYLLSKLNYVPLVILVIALPLVFRAMMPRGEDAVLADEKSLVDESVPIQQTDGKSFASKLEGAWILNIVLIALGCGYIAIRVSKGLFSMELNMLVTIFLLLGIALHGRPRNYIHAVKRAAQVAGPILLQFPMYGGIMGIMTATGLADLIAQYFIGFSNSHTLPFWSFMSSLLITMFVPSAGGHWILQAQFVVPAAQQLHVAPSAVAIAVAWGEGIADTIQPMWLAPLLAIAGISMGRVMGYIVIPFFIMVAVVGTTLLLLG